jgi:PRTRC genetic system protein A
MQITELAPFISCVCGPNEFQEALNKGYKEIYIVSNKGTILKHHQLRGENRFVRVKVDKIPGFTIPQTEVEIKESMNFLPAGKIPFSLYEQIEAFFRKVIQVRGTALEAMIFILWNKDQGYHLFVPEQRVGAASVSFDPSTIPGGSTVVVNVHSHGHMNSFFSGTDDNNDKDLVQFSGVFGNFQTAVPTTIWRFNYYLTKFKCETKDIFETPVKEGIEVPQEWMDQVTQPTFSQNKGGHSNLGNVGRNTAEHLKPWQFQKGMNRQGQQIQAGQPVLFPTVSSVEKRNAQEDLLGGKDTPFIGFEPDESSFSADVSPSTPHPNFTPPKMPGIVWKWDNEKGQYRNVAGTEEENDPEAIHFDGTPSVEDEINDAATAAFMAAINSSDEAFAHLREVDAEEADSGQLGKPHGITPEGVELKSLSLPNESGNLEAPGDHIEGWSEDIAIQYEAINSRYGVDVADAWWGIDSEMHNLHEHPLLLTSLMGDMYNLLSDDDKFNFFTDMISNLPEKYLQQIQANGL